MADGRRFCNLITAMALATTIGSSAWGFFAQLPLANRDLLRP
jgi:xanthine/uracil/vitamin C permease (AzgA family)